MRKKMTIIIEEIPGDLGGGFNAFIPELGKYAYVGEGGIEIDALVDLGETIKGNLIDVLKVGGTFEEVTTCPLPDAPEEKCET